MIGETIKILWRQDKEMKFSTKTWPFYPKVNTERTVKQTCPMCPWETYYMPLRLAMNRAQHKITKLRKTLQNFFYNFSWKCSFQTWTLWMTTSWHDVKKLDIPDRAASKWLVLDLSQRPSTVYLFWRSLSSLDIVNNFSCIGKEKVTQCSNYQLSYNNLLQTQSYKPQQFYYVHGSAG